MLHFLALALQIKFEPPVIEVRTCDIENASFYVTRSGPITYNIYNLLWPSALLAYSVIDRLRLLPVEFRNSLMFVGHDFNSIVANLLLLIFRVNIAEQILVKNSNKKNKFKNREFVL